LDVLLSEALSVAASSAKAGRHTVEPTPHIASKAKRAALLVIGGEVS
jgi:hypothetical protein